MNESGPIRKTHKDPDDGSGFGDFIPLAPNIWRASHDGKYFLLKTPKDSSAESMELLHREYELSCNLQHPYIVRTLGFESDTAKGPAIVMEYIKGRTLGEFLTEKPSVTARKKVLSQILDAVEHVNTAGILHNDLKAENILVTDIGDYAKIIDFGLSETEADHLNRRLGGTPGFSAPEVLSGDTECPSSSASDIYSLGIIIELIFPGKYLAIVRKCTRRLPEERFRNVSSLRKALSVRDRIPLVAAAGVTIVIVIAAAIVPDIVKTQRERTEQTVFQEKIWRIQNDLTRFYNEAADSLRDRRIVPSQETGLDIRNNFVMRTVAYRETEVEQKLLPVCDSVYARLISDLTETVLDIPLSE